MPVMHSYSCRVHHPCLSCCRKYCTPSILVHCPFIYLHPRRPGLPIDNMCTSFSAMGSAAILPLDPAKGYEFEVAIFGGGTQVNTSESSPLFLHSICGNRCLLAELSRVSAWLCWNRAAREEVAGGSAGIVLGRLFRQSYSEFKFSCSNISPTMSPQHTRCVAA